MKHILICDDDPEVCSALREQADRMMEEKHDISVFSSRKALTEYLACQRSSWQFILLLDIMLEEESSIPSSAQLLKRMPNLKVIYITGHIEYCEDIFFSSPTGFLVKPVSGEKLQYLLKKASQELDKAAGQVLSVFSVQGEQKEFFAWEIRYLESAGRIVTVHTIHGDVKCARKLNELEKELPYGFLRCHQSYLVNCDYIQKMLPKQLVLQDEVIVPIAKTRKEAVREYLFRLAAESL